MADDLSLTEWTVLGVLAEAPRHGFAVARELADDAPLGQVWTVPRPLVYRAIGRLADDGLVEAVRAEEGDRGPTRTVHRVTRTGRRRYRCWLDAPVGHPRDVRTELLAKLVLRKRAGVPSGPLVRAQREHFAPVAAGLARAARRAEGPDRIVARWRLESIRAVERTLTAIAADDQRG